MKALIVDDEPLARESLRLLLEKTPGVDVVGECPDGPSAIEAIREKRPDLLLLDVQMPEMNGFEVLQALGEPPPAVIFVTAYDQFALRAFEVHALDYLLKPYSDERFRQALERARETVRLRRDGRLRRQLQGLLADYRNLRESRAEPVDRLVIRGESKSVLVNVRDIDWIEAADYYARLHVGRRTHLLRESLASLEERLDPRSFFRIHRSAIVNLDRVRELQSSFKGGMVVILADRTRLKLARSRRRKLEKRLQSKL